MMKFSLDRALADKLTCLILERGSELFSAPVRRPRSGSLFRHFFDQQIESLTSGKNPLGCGAWLWLWLVIGPLRQDSLDRFHAATCLIRNLLQRDALLFFALKNTPRVERRNHWKRQKPASTKGGWGNQENQDESEANVTKVAIVGGNVINSMRFVVSRVLRRETERKDVHNSPRALAERQTTKLRGRNWCGIPFECSFLPTTTSISNSYNRADHLSSVGQRH